MLPELRLKDRWRIVIQRSKDIEGLLLLRLFARSEDIETLLLLGLSARSCIVEVLVWLEVLMSGDEVIEMLLCSQVLMGSDIIDVSLRHRLLTRNNIVEVLLMLCLLRRRNTLVERLLLKAGLLLRSTADVRWSIATLALHRIAAKATTIGLRLLLGVPCLRLLWVVLRPHVLFATSETILLCWLLLLRCCTVVSSTLLRHLA
jgi:hypothetical protein